MDKTDKFLYGGFDVVAISGIVAMLVAVFSPPKQVVEETADTPTPPQIEQPTPEPIVVIEPTQPVNELGVYTYYDDNGNEIVPTQEILDAFKALDEERKRKENEEFKREEEQKVIEQAEKEWWESRKDWMERFPSKPTLNHEVPFDPTVFDLKKMKAREWPEEKKDEAYWDMMKRAEHHRLLKEFYESWVPYTEEFEQRHDIVKDRPNIRNAQRLPSSVAKRLRYDL